MSLVINHNMMALVAARNLGNHYSALATSTQRLSSGLRINSAADDAAGLAVSESMKASIAGMDQGVRNAGDALSMLQTADGAMSVIDEKLIRMKELAEQAATGTYTTAQRLIMDSEYQAMASEIDRIANATTFNGVKLLDGSLSALNAGSGMKIHFGTGNSSAEDYYYIRVDDMRATSATGLQIGGGATAAILAATQDFASGGVVVASGGASGQTFAYSYNASGIASGHPSLSDFAGFYNLATGSTLDGMVNLINQGTSARTFLDLSAASGLMTADALSGYYITAGNLRVYFMSATMLTGGGSGWSADNAVGVDVVNFSALGGTDVASAIVDAINGTTRGNVWAIASGSTVMLVYKNPGVVGNGAAVATGTFAAGATSASIAFSSLTMDGGGETWAIASAAAQTDGNRYLQLTGNNRGAGYTVTVQDANTLSSGNLTSFGWANSSVADTGDFAVTAPSGTGNWDGADILTQSGAQLALGAIDTAINTKDTQRAATGAISNRLNNTIANLQIQGENLQAAQSRIADVDVASEMTNFTRNSILTQAATAMLAQANSLPRLALQLLGGGGV